MSRIIDILPGVPMSVREVTREVVTMWDQPELNELGNLADFRASQMNLLLHFGRGTEAEEAHRCFQQAIAFAQRYPCRIIVLEAREGEAGDDLQGKLFSQCYLGKNLRDLCCCEALMLSYPVSMRDLVEAQVSLWIEADLPLYYWVHRVDIASIEKNFGSLLKQARRVIFDRAIDGATLGSLNLPNVERRRDLAHARTLPLRQTLGQMLSSYDPKALVEGLETVVVRCSSAFQGEASILLDWVHHALEGCAQRAKIEPSVGYSLSKLDIQEEHCVSMRWSYADGERFLKWHYNARARTGLLEGDLGSGRFFYPLHIEPLEEAQVLAEAMFFG